MTDIRRRRRHRRRASLWLAAGIGAAAAALAEPALSDPLPWAYGASTPGEKQLAYQIPRGLKDGRCHPDMFKASAAPHLVGRGRDMRSGAWRNAGGATSRLDNTAIGTLLSAIGGKRPHPISRRDEICFGQSFEYAPDRDTVAWTDTTRTVQFSIIPMRTMQTSDGRFCREYAAKATVNGHAADVYGTACRQPDGDWLLVD